MKLGQRIAHVTAGTSDGWAIVYRVRQMVHAGERVLNLTIGEHDIRTDRRILDAMHEAAVGGATGYTFGPGLPELREAIAARVRARTGVATRAENIIVTPGGQSALFAAHMVLLDPGSTGLYCSPHYPTYPGTIRTTGAEALAVPTRSRDAFQPQPEAILAAAAGAQNPRSLLVNTPNNPTGVIYGRETVEDIARAATEADLWLISDEVYDTQVWEGEHLTPRALPGMAERTIVVGSMSKSHAMTGSRLGWLVAPPEVVQAATVLATQTTYGVAPFIQHAALNALRQGDDFEEEIAAPFRRRRAIAAAALAGSNAIRLIPTSGAMYVMLDIRATGLSGDDFATRLLDAERIAVMPGESFGPSSAGHLRVAMTISDDDFAEAMTRLAAFAERLLP